MAKRGGRRANAGWWIVALLIAVAIALWWMSARRAEAPAPPASVPGSRTLKRAPAEGEQPGGHDGEEITAPEKQELERVLRERGAAPPP